MVFKINQGQLLMLTQLRKNARQSITLISKAVRMPISTVHDKLKTNAGNVINKYTCLLNFSKLGFNCRAQIILKVNKKEKPAIREHLMCNPNINSIYRINNGYDFLAETIFKDLTELDEFMEKLDENFNIKEKKVYYIMEDIARERFMTDPIHTNMVGY